MGGEEYSEFPNDYWRVDYWKCTACICALTPCPLAELRAQDFPPTTAESQSNATCRSELINARRSVFFVVKTFGNIH